MCGGGSGVSEYKEKKDAAQELSDLIYHSGYMAEGLRNLLRLNWPKVARLAHQIHNEETSPDAALKRAAKNVAALNADGIMRVVNGDAAEDVIASFKLLAKKAMLG